MSAYRAPLQDMRFVLEALDCLEQVGTLPGCEDLTADVAAAVLEEAGRFAAGELVPLARTGDREGARFNAGRVESAPGYAQAYRKFVAGGWNALAGPREYGGEGLPQLIAFAAQEIWNGADLAFGLCPMLTSGVVEALELAGSAELKALYLPRLVAGQWTGTMNLTEPQAGSDLAAIATTAVREGDRYRLRGTKIFVTWGEHDLAENIVHLVLARTPGAPPGVKGLSLFLVPKFLVNADGSLGERNDLRCVSIEEKLGIHASPTCVLAYGDRDGAIGWLVGEENRGLEYMFITMNYARLAVGIEAVGLAERAYQRATAYARERVQGRRDGVSVTIGHHPDVRRMLLDMRARTEAMRALACTAAAGLDAARREPDAARRAAALVRLELLTPIVKGWCTEQCVEIASTGIQVHGGMGYVEETGAAQDLRDARITPIYEGTTAIQANDLAVRKVAADRGAAMRALIREMRATEAELARHRHPDLAALHAAFGPAVSALSEATDWMVDAASDPRAAVAVPYLGLCGLVAGGWQLCRGALAAAGRLERGEGDAAVMRGKLVTARFFSGHRLTLAPGLAATVLDGASSVLALPPDGL